MKITEKFNSKEIFFTSDTHFGHKNIIKYDNRPFKDVNQMNAELVLRWNEVVKPSDTVFHLGDFALTDSKTAKWILNSLNGNIYLAMGNHDRLKNVSSLGFKNVQDVYEITVLDQDTRAYQKIFMSHYAHIVWNKSHHGSWNLHGHSHGNLPRDNSSYRLDVGTNIYDYYPLSFDKIKKLMSNVKYKSIDHHV